MYVHSIPRLRVFICSLPEYNCACDSILATFADLKTIWIEKDRSAFEYKDVVSEIYKCKVLDSIKTRDIFINNV